MRGLCLVLLGTLGCFVSDITEDTSSQATGGTTTQGGGGSAPGGGGSAPGGGGQGGMPSSSTTAGGGTGGSQGGSGGAGGEGGGEPCVLDAGEDCEDCNVVANDGCTNHTVDDGWYCPNELAFCWQFSGFELGAPTQLPVVGGGGGGDFTETCPDGFGLVGLTAAYDGGAMSKLKAIQLRCAPILLQANGDLGWSVAGNVGARHGGSPGGGENVGAFDCPMGKFWVGYEAFRETGGGMVVHGLELHCAQFQQQALNYAHTAPETLPLIGLTTSTAVTHDCQDGALLTGVVGKAGARVDQFSGTCRPATPAYCGDGVTNGTEACDDADIDPDDGCDFCN